MISKTSHNQHWHSFYNSLNPTFTCKFSILISIHFPKDIFPLVITVLNKSRWSVKFIGYFKWTCYILFFGNYPLKSRNLIMSVFCSNTLIFSPACWKCTLRGPDFKIFQGEKHRLILNLLCLLALIIHELGFGDKANRKSTMVKKF